jgi:hypothetical protein
MLLTGAGSTPRHALYGTEHPDLLADAPRAGAACWQETGRAAVVRVPGTGVAATEAAGGAYAPRLD